MCSHFTDSKEREEFDSALLAPLAGWEHADATFLARIMAADDETEGAS